MSINSAENLAGAKLRQAIESRSLRLGVLGLGFVGTPVAAAFAAAGLRVTGVDRDASRATAVDEGRPPFAGDEPGLAETLAAAKQAGKLRAGTDITALQQTEVVLIAVDTPIDPETRQPHYSALRAALRDLAPQLSPGQLVIVESTLAPGTIRDLVVPILEAGSGLRASPSHGSSNLGARDPRNTGTFFVAHCPERVMPGRLLANLRDMARVVGGWTPEAASIARSLYRLIVNAELVESDALSAEIVKTGENAFRDVQIAFANELAIVCEDLGADVWHVRELINKSPGRAVLMPGAGVGGHCIPKDPWLLLAGAGETVTPRLIPAARLVNDGMPAHLVALVTTALRTEGVSVDGARVLLLGMSYREDTDDTRAAPSTSVKRILEQRGAKVLAHDPWIPRYADRPLGQLIDGIDVVLLMVAHSAYVDLDWHALRKRTGRALLIDGRNHVASAARAAGWSTRVLGDGRGHFSRKLDPQAGDPVS